MSHSTRWLDTLTALEDVQNGEQRLLSLVSPGLCEYDALAGNFRTLRDCSQHLA